MNWPDPHDHPRLPHTRGPFSWCPWPGGFLWALKSGQYEDLDGAAERILIDVEVKAAADLKDVAGKSTALRKTAKTIFSTSVVMHKIAVLSGFFSY